MNRLRMVWQRVLFGGDRHLRAYEATCLATWRAHLTREAALVADRQISRLRLIQRSPSGTIVSFYDRENPRGNLPEELLFPLRDRNSRVARIELTSTAGELAVHVVLHKGRLASLEFDVPHLQYIGGMSSHSEAGEDGFHVKRVSILADVMENGRYREDPWLPPAGLLKEWSDKWPVERLGSPLESGIHRELVKDLETVFPSEYLEVAEQAARVRIGGVLIYGLPAIRRIPLPEGSFLVIAELENEVDLTVKEKGRSEEIFLIDHSDHDVAIRTASSFREVIERWLQSGRS